MLIERNTLQGPLVSTGRRYDAIARVKGEVIVRLLVPKVASSLGILENPLSTLREGKVSSSETVLNIWKLACWLSPEIHVAPTTRSLIRIQTKSIEVA